jgi:hypothetical protein
MTLKLSINVFWEVEQGRSLNSCCFGGIAGFVFMVEVVGTDRCVTISDFVINNITN